MSKMKIKKGDKVLVLSGKDKGKTGLVEKVVAKSRSVIIPKVNVFKKHIKATKKNPKGSIAEIERPLAVSNVQLICPSCGKKTRVGYLSADDKKSRVCKKCKKVIVFKKEDSNEG